MKFLQTAMWEEGCKPVFRPCRSALVSPDHHSEKKVLILTMKLCKIK
jgi:hypothetical protein